MRHNIHRTFLTGGSTGLLAVILVVLLGAMALGQPESTGQLENTEQSENTGRPESVEQPTAVPAITPQNSEAEEAFPVSSPTTSRLGVVIPILDELNDVMTETVKRRIEEAKEKHPFVIVFELNTPGGTVTSGLAIADLIKNLADIKTVAWVNTNAHSGGTAVAVACDEIVMARSSRMGDVQVILMMPGSAEAVPEDLKAKATTPVLSEFRASARLNGYDQVLCEAFVVPEREVWWVENTKTGERKFVFRDEKIELIGDDKKDKAKSAAGKVAGALLGVGKGKRGWKLVESYHDIILDVEVDTIQPIVRDDQLLEMSAAEAHAYGFNKGIVTGKADLLERYGLDSLTWLQATWSENLAFWMTSMYVRGFLLVLILLGAYVEFNTPGVGVPGLVALICLAVFVGAPYLTGLANIWEILFIFLGILLIGLEVLVIPGFGAAGIAGLVLLLIGLVATFAPDEAGHGFPIYLPTSESTIEGLKLGFVTVVSSMIVSLVGMVALSKFLPKTPYLRGVVPPNPTPSDVQVEDPYHGAAHVGDVGVAKTSLRPAGKAVFGSTLVDVVTRGEIIDPGARLEVVERRGNRVVVRVAKA